MLSLNIHANAHLQNAWNLFGVECFTFEIIEHCSVDLLLIREQHWFDKTECYERNIGYNFYKTAGSPRGNITSIETKKKLSVALKGVPKSEEHRRKYSKWQTGRILTDDHKANISLSRIGNKFRRNSSKWSYADGYSCKCDECREKRAIVKKNWDLKNNENRKKLDNSAIDVDRANSTSISG
jgi:group I intron endonuclease